MECVLDLPLRDLVVGPLLPLLPLAQHINCGRSLVWSPHMNRSLSILSRTMGFQRWQTLLWQHRSVCCPLSGVAVLRCNTSSERQ